MRKVFKALSALAVTAAALGIFAFSTKSYAATTTTTTSAYDSISTPATSQEGTTLHAWNWSMNEIKANMADIAAAGYTSVQTSPMQPQKDYWNGNTVADGWWKLYQPLGFCIATKNNSIGTKDELKAMCDEADKYGIKVIVDVVSNHLAGSTTTLDAAVKEYEPAIYGTNGTYAGGALLHEATSTGVYDSDPYYVTHGNLGMPDIDTGNSTVQERVISLLKEYIDVGVDGFRFDAAKHIETPSDSCGSTYWPTILNAATQYAESTKGFDPYYYGEILNNPGSGRSYSMYTPYMSVIDNCTGNYCTKNINELNASGAASGSGYNSNDQGEAIPSNKAVIWAESHDTYEDGSSVGYSQLTIDKSYAFAASRSSSMALYFARPESNTTTLLGEMGTTAWKSDLIEASNKFHNYFNGSSEWMSSYGEFAMNVRYNDSECGMVIVNTGCGACSNVTVPSVMKDGTYTDQVTGNTFTVSGGVLNGNIGSTGVAVLFNPQAKGTYKTVTTNVTDTIDITACANAAGLTSTGKKLASLSTGDENVTVEATTVGTSSSKVYGTISSSKFTAANWRFYSGESGTFTVSSPYTIKSITITYAKSNSTNAYLYSNATSSTVTSGTAVSINAKSASFTAKSKTSTNYNCQIKKIVVVYEKTTTEFVPATTTTTTTPATDYKTLYFVNYQKWSTPYAYVWGDSSQAAWPGTAMTYVKDNANGYGIYSLSYDANKYANVIFNNGSEQTVDTVISSTKDTYYLAGTKDSSSKYTVTNISYADVDTVGKTTTTTSSTTNIKTTTAVTDTVTTTIDMINCANASGLTATGKKLASLSTGDSNVTVKATTTGTSSSKLYGTVSSGKWTAANWRFYSSESGTFTVSSTYTIKSITITYAKSNSTNAYLYCNGTSSTVTSGTAITVGAKSVSFTAKSKTSTNYNCQIKKIVVVYEIPTVTTTTTSSVATSSVSAMLGTTTTTATTTKTATNGNTIATKRTTVTTVAKA